MGASAGRRLINVGKNGAPSPIRTNDLLITNQLLYQLSYRGIAAPDNGLDAA